MLVNKGSSLIEFQTEGVVTQKLHLAHFLSFVQDILKYARIFKKVTPFFKKNYLKTKAGQKKDIKIKEIKISRKEKFWYKRI